MTEQNSADDQNSGRGVSSYLNDLLGSEAPELLVPGKRNFQPWHRPRKQYVRRDQWLKELSELVNALPASETELRYLTLPGNDFLDVRYFHDKLCVPQGRRLRFLGFNTTAGIDTTQAINANTNQHAVWKLSHIVQSSSDLLRDDLRSVGRLNSVSHKKVLAFGAFHAINIDLCDGIARGSANANHPNLFDAMQVLLECQSRTIHDSLLFITTRIDSDQVPEEVQANLSTILESNVARCQPFSDEISGLWQCPPDVNAIAHLPHEDRFILGFSKWIVSTAIKHRLSVTLRSVLTYRVRESASVDDLMSIVILLKPFRSVGQDPHRLANLGDTRSEVDLECQLATRIPARIFHRKSVDDKLREDAQLLEECLGESEGLLKSLGYDIGDYRLWAAEKENANGSHC